MIDGGSKTRQQYRNSKTTCPDMEMCAFILIYTRCEERVCMDLHSLRTFTDLTHLGMAKLASIYLSPDVLNKLCLHRKINHTLYDESTSLRDHINLLLQTANELASMNSPMSDEDLAMTILESLPASWGHTVQLFSDKASHGKLCSNDIVSMLQFEAECKASKGGLSLVDEENEGDGQGREGAV
jgi:hypothetical protein